MLSPLCHASVRPAFRLSKHLETIAITWVPDDCCFVKTVAFMTINTMYNASEVMRAYNHFTNNLSNVIKQNQTAIYRVPCLMTEIISSTAEGNKLSFL